jgi:quercetin dioxygenase-like cupin family protein
MHSHANDSEFFFVLEGTLTISDPDGDIEAGPGDFCFLRAGGSQAFRNNTRSTVRAIAMVTPGIDAHRFFKGVHDELDGVIDVPTVIDIAGRHSIAIAT